MSDRKSSEQRGQIDDIEQYQALRDKGMSKEKAARIANTPSDDMDYNSEPYENRTKKQLTEKARDVGIEGRSEMNKSELIEALRNH